MNEGTATPQSGTTAENLLGQRIVAGIIDLIVVFIIAFVIGLLLGESESSTEGGGGSVSFEVTGWPFVLTLVLALGYYLVMEATSGQTLGKKVMGIKVVALDGQLDWGKAAIRTILRLIDGLFFYLVAVILVAVTKRNQRLGDMAAGTVVVRASQPAATPEPRF